MPNPYPGDVENAFPWRWPNPKVGPYEVFLRMGDLDGRYEVLAVEVRSVGDQLPITSTVLRTVRVHELAGKLAAQTLPLLSDPWALELVTNEADMDAEWHRRREVAVAPMRQAFERSRDAVAERVKTEATLEGVARIYVEARRRQLHPTKAVAEALGITHNAAAHRVRRAREAGHLGKTTRGRQSWG